MKSKMIGCFVHWGEGGGSDGGGVELIRHHDNLRCFALILQLFSLCHIRLLNQESVRRRGFAPVTTLAPPLPVQTPPTFHRIATFLN